MSIIKHSLKIPFIYGKNYLFICMRRFTIKRVSSINVQPFFIRHFKTTPFIISRSKFLIIDVIFPIIIFINIDVIPITLMWKLFFMGNSGHEKLLLKLSCTQIDTIDRQSHHHLLSSCVDPSYQYAHCSSQ